MSADLVSLAAVLLDGGVIDAKDCEELENEELSLESRIAKLIISVGKKHSEGSKGLADILEECKEQHGDSEAYKALKQLLDSSCTSSRECHTESSVNSGIDINLLSYFSWHFILCEDVWRWLQKMVKHQRITRKGYFFSYRYSTLFKYTIQLAT